jgi:hypothetical protein
MKIHWKIFKKDDFYYFKLTKYVHTFTVHTYLKTEYRNNLNGRLYVFDNNINLRKYIKTLIVFLTVNSMLKKMSTNHK